MKELTVLHVIVYAILIKIKIRLKFKFNWHFSDSSTLLLITRKPSQALKIIDILLCYNSWIYR